MPRDAERLATDMSQPAPSSGGTVLKPNGVRGGSVTWGGWISLLLVVGALGLDYAEKPFCGSLT